MNVTLKPEEKNEETVVEHSPYDMLITDDIDFRVETRGLHTTDEDGGMHMPDHEATIRINPDGTENPLWVVGSRYEVVDHREIIKGFAAALDKADLVAQVEHQVFVKGCRIYSTFTLDNTYDIGGSEPARPFFSLQTSHDGSLKVGFTVGARVGRHVLRVSKTIYGAWAKHTKGVNIELTLKEISKALDSFVTEIIPMWERMGNTKIDLAHAKRILEDAVKRNVVSKRRAEAIDLNDVGTVWDVYTAMVDKVCELTTKRSTEERTFDRNTKVGEFFRKLHKATGE